MNKVDYLIVGQGIAGSILAHELLKNGQSIHLINHETENTSSNKAAGIYNPITGRRMVKTWLADEIFPGLEAYYQDLQKSYEGIFLYPKVIYRPFYSVEELNDWEGRAASDNFEIFIKQLSPESIKIDGIDDPFGGLRLNFSGYVDLPALVATIRNFLKDRGMYQAGMFLYEDLTIGKDLISFEDIEAKRVIFCDGPGATSNPLWKHLPFKLVRGEIMEIEADLPEDIIVNRGVFILPKNGYFSVGSTYDHEFLSYTPTVEGINSLKRRLSNIYRGSYKVVNETAGVRPATFDRRPFIGPHHVHENVLIFNGFGTKGVSLVPYFARHLVNYLIGRGKLRVEVDVSRINRKK